MSVLRILMVTRRFWPLVGDDATQRLAMLASGLRKYHVQAEVVAARYAASWPRALSVNETPLHRPAPAPRSEWSMARYTRALTNWLKANAGGYDALYADSMREEGAVVVEVAKRLGIPSILRYHGTEIGSDAAWWGGSRSNRKCATHCLKADHLIAGRASAEQALIAAGAQPNRIQRIQQGYQAAEPRTPEARKSARHALSAINSDLFVPLDAQVLLVTNRMNAEGGLRHLVDTLPSLLDRFPRLRVWLLNDGPDRMALYGALRGTGVQNLISMPGSFSSFAEPLLAADAYVLPSASDGLDFYLPSVLSAGVPAAVVDSLETRRMLGTSFSDCQSFAANDTGSLLNAITATLEPYDISQEKARRIRQVMLQSPYDQMVEQHVRLFERLTGKHPTPNPSTAELTP
ncbi:hypothetical protein FF011L_09750 [Roseimaritima multifibrata]|uniref:Glycosyltransferase subfamily 4-like N-terminal domain-containing protein n=1 Tax=Roseimaritima multifibrata TaxID=1930274 RepID=A0A517MBG4_9BACT|nr:glycosyltransferase [Roseimaritima multifibrata]QDS92238.1 hypothetical protein FF011L_09750 [Roseimaritima multifibrata]